MKMPTADDFDDWWDNYDILPDPEDKIEEDTPMWWAWQGWKAALETLETNQAEEVTAALDRWSGAGDKTDET